MGTNLLDKHRNADGTYNGVTLLSEISGLSVAEVQWTADRIKQLMVVEKRSRAEALRIVREEAKAKPWNPY